MAKRNPPALLKAEDYHQWKTEVQLWSEVTKHDEDDRATLVILEIKEPKAKVAALEIKIDERKCKDGIIKLMKKLDDVFDDDPKQDAFKLYEEFDNMKRDPQEPIKSYIDRFKRCVKLLEDKGVKLPDTVLCYKLLKTSKLDAITERVIRTSCSTLDVSEMEKSLLKAFDIHLTANVKNEDNGNSDETSFTTLFTQPTVPLNYNTLTPVNYTQPGQPQIYQPQSYQSQMYLPQGFQHYNQAYHQYDQPFYHHDQTFQHHDQQFQHRDQQFQRRPNYYARNRGGRGNSGGKKSDRACEVDRNDSNGVNNNDPGSGRNNSNGFRGNTRGGNSSCGNNNGSRGNYQGGRQSSQNQNYQTYHTTAEHDEGSLILLGTEQEELTGLMLESLNLGLLDSGASKSVCGERWFRIYSESLPDCTRNRIEEIAMEENVVFRFGNAEAQKAIKRVRIPAYLGEKNVRIDIYVIKESVPLLISREAMSKADMRIEYRTNELSIFGIPHPMKVSTSGLYLIPIIPRSTEEFSQHVLLTANSTNDNKKIAEKLHRVFIHAPTDRIMKLLSKSSIDPEKQKEIKKELEKIAKSCETCISVRRPAPKPKVSLPMSDSFNEKVAMDIKVIEGKFVLHIIDTFTRYSCAAILKNKSAKEVIRVLFRHWIAIFGQPRCLFTDNGSEFVNEELMELAEKYDVNLQTTPVEAPFANGICERHNGVLGQMTKKLLKDRIPLDIAICWCVNAKNSLLNVYGFSPQQLVFGKNWTVPNVMEYKNLPVLNERTASSIVQANMEAMKSARVAFMKAEADSRIARALKSRVQGYKNMVYLPGDRVYYKRLDNNDFHGPGTIIGTCENSVFIKHGGKMVKLHPSKVILHERADADINGYGVSGRKQSPSSNTRTTVGDKSPESTVVAIETVDESDSSDDDSEDDSDQELNHSIEQLTATYDHHVIENENSAVEDIPVEDLPELETQPDNEVIDIPSEDGEVGDTVEAQNTIVVNTTEEADKDGDNDDPDARVSEHSSVEEEDLISDHVESDTEETPVNTKPESETPPRIEPIADVVELIQTTEHTQNTEDILTSIINEDQEILNSDMIEDDNETPDSTQQPDITIEVGDVKTKKRKGNAKPVKFRIGDKVAVEIEQGDGIREVQLYKRGGKSTGTYPYSWNVRDLETKEEFSIEFDLVENFYIRSGETDTEAVEEVVIPVEKDNVIYLTVPKERHKEKLVIEAKEKELENWKRMNVYDEVDDIGQPTMSVRWVITEKSENFEEFEKKVKARLCVRGFEEELDESVESPTSEKRTIRLGFNLAVQNNWCIETVDIKSAFLQSNDIERSVFVKPPKEARVPGKIWQLIKPVYGLDDGPRCWYQSLAKYLESIGGIQCKLDKALFSFYDRQKNLKALCLAHIDDLIISGEERDVKDIVEKIKSKYTISKHKTKLFTYVGLEIEQTYDGIKITQNDYIQNIQKPNFIVGQRTKETLLAPDEVSMYRKLLGKLQWVVGQSRPDIKFPVLYCSTKPTRATVGDMLNIFRVTDKLKTEQLAINIKKLPDGQLSIVTFTDASYGSLNDKVDSAEGMLVFLAVGTSCSIVSWNSRKVKTVATSAMQAELAAVMNGIRETLYIRELLSDLIYQDRDSKVIPVYVFTDGQNLVRKIYSQTPSQELQLRKNLAYVVDMIMEEQIKIEWLDGKRQIADLMTKEKSQVKELFRRAVEEGALPQLPVRL